MSGNEPNASWSELASHQSRMERRELASVSFLRTCTCYFLATSKPYRAPPGSACILQGLRRWVATGSSFHHATGFVLLQHAFRSQKEIPGSLSLAHLGRDKLIYYRQAKDTQWQQPASSFIFILAAIDTARLRLILLAQISKRHTS